jgi:phosphatidylglycerol:prolipoprotein diacylglycerol transferase
MPSSFTIIGITLHFYGLIIGVAMITVTRISEWLLQKQGHKGEAIWDIAFWVILAGLIGARAWHVATDWPLYTNDWVKSLYVWQGGMSILGGVAGGMVGLYFCQHSLKKYGLNVRTILDVFAISLPFGQAIGRLGNWVNQELYGYPTNLPWKLFIDQQHRVQGFETYQFFHPLFAYEAIALVVIGLGLWKLSQKKSFEIGKGALVLLYFILYSGVRFLLEFLRIEKTTLGQSALGVNQIIMGIVCITFLGLFIKKFLLLKAEK